MVVCLLTQSVYSWMSMSSVTEDSESRELCYNLCVGVKVCVEACV